MILLTSQLLFESSGQRVLTSIVYDEVGDRFVRVSQKISAELTQDLSSPNPMVDIMDVINLDYIDYVFNDDEIEEIFEMVDDGPDNDIIKRAKEFIVRYKRDKKINKFRRLEIQKERKENSTRKEQSYICIRKSLVTSATSDSA